MATFKLRLNRPMQVTQLNNFGLYGDYSHLWWCLHVQHTSIGLYGYNLYAASSMARNSMSCVRRYTATAISSSKSIDSTAMVGPASYIAVTKRSAAQLGFLLCLQQCLYYGYGSGPQLQ